MDRLRNTQYSSTSASTNPLASKVPDQTEDTLLHWNLTPHLGRLVARFIHHLQDQTTHGANEKLPSLRTLPAT